MDVDLINCVSLYTCIKFSRINKKYKNNFKPLMIFTLNWTFKNINEINNFIGLKEGYIFSSAT